MTIPILIRSLKTKMTLRKLNFISLKACKHTQQYLTSRQQNNCIENISVNRPGATQHPMDKNKPKFILFLIKN